MSLIAAAFALLLAGWTGAWGATQWAVGATFAVVLSGGVAWATGRLLERRFTWLIESARRRVASPEETTPAKDQELATLTRAFAESNRAVGRRIAELERDRARLSAILAGMVEGVLVVDGHGQVQLVNDAARRMLRLEGSSIGRRYLELIRHPDIAAQISRALAGESPPGLELTFTRDATQVFVARAAPVSGPTSGAVLVLHDIGDLRRADRIRRDFVANVSHELRTPLTAIRGYIEALLDAPADAEQTRRFLEIAARHSARMETLVKDLLRLARLDAGQEVLESAPVSVTQLFTSVIADLESQLHARQQRVTTEVAPEAETVIGDAAKLHDIFRNLLENASAYAPPGSAITLSAAREDGRIALRIADEGPGIPEADLSRIFERFYRVDKARSRESGGTGLGLSIVRHLTELHGGEVRAANRPDRGAVFTVWLPDARTTSPAST